MTYLLHLLVYFDIYLVVALSLELVVGRCGLLTVAHAGYYAIGGYSYAILAIRLGWGIVAASLAAVLVAAVLSLLVSLPSWRLRGDFFFLASLAVQAVIYSALSNWSAPNAPVGSLRNLTNGPFGITMIPAPTVMGHVLTQPIQFALFTTAIALFSGFVLFRLESSPWGRMLMAMRDDELAARGLGKNTRLAKVQAFAISSAFAALAGVLYVAHIRYIDPTSGRLDESIFMLSIVIVGGLGVFRGPIVGAALLIAIPEALRFLALPDTLAANVRLLLYGLLLLVLMHLRPQGIAGKYEPR
jgi:branched-chain amino acid transport system permease protein